MELEGIPLHEILERTVHPINELSLHLLPRRDMAFTFRPESGEEIAFRSEWVEHRRSDLLRLCNGRRTVGDICSLLMDADWTVEEVLRQLRGAIACQYLSLIPPDHFRPLWVTGSRDREVAAHYAIECTSRCNLRCAHCYLSAGPEGGQDFPALDLFRVFRQLREIGVRSVELTGGEPTIHPHWDDILEEAFASFPQVSVLTNGTLITPERARRLGSRSGRVVVGVSIDGARPETHDRRRGVPGSFVRTMTGLRFLRDAGVPFRVSMSVYPDAYDEIEATLQMAREEGARWFSYNAAGPIGRGANLSWNEWEEPRRRFAAVEERLQQEYPGFLALVPPERMREIEEEGCGAASRSLALGADGNVRACVLMPQGRGVLGNVLREPIEQILDHRSARAFRSVAAPGGELCTGCRYVHYCRNCPAKALGLVLERRADCRWAREQSETEALLA